MFCAESDAESASEMWNQQRAWKACSNMFLFRPRVQLISWMQARSSWTLLWQMNPWLYFLNPPPRTSFLSFELLGWLSSKTQAHSKSVPLPKITYNLFLGTKRGLCPITSWQLFLGQQQIQLENSIMRRFALLPFIFNANTSRKLEQCVRDQVVVFLPDFASIFQGDNSIQCNYLPKKLWSPGYFSEKKWW